MHASAARPMTEAANRSPCNASNSWAPINIRTMEDAVMRMTNWRLADFSFVRPSTTEYLPDQSSAETLSAADADVQTLL
jgi:hypothetical protein